MELDRVTAPGTVPIPSSAPRKVRLRPAAAADAKPCGNIIHDAFLGIAAEHGFPPDFVSATDGVSLAEALVADPAIFSLAAEADGHVVGSNFLWEGDPVRGVGPITVDPQYQGGGIGWQLMTAVLERAGPGARVRLVQDAFNTRSVALYASLGFEVKEPLLLLRGSPRVVGQHGVVARPLAEADLPACDMLCEAVHGVARAHELRQALRLFKPVVVERAGRITGYLTAPAFWLMNHGVAETVEDMRALLGGAAAMGSEPISLLLPTRQAELFRWCLSAGMRVVKPMTLMARGDYQDPRGAWFPPVLY